MRRGRSTLQAALALTLVAGLSPGGIGLARAQDPGATADAGALLAASDTVFVGNAAPVCSNSGPGTAAIPYCSIGAALAAHHAPGTTIVVTSGTYREQVILPASGTANAPITIRAVGTADVPVVIEGAEDYGNSALWSQVRNNVWLARGVIWAPKQVRAHGVRLTPWTGALGDMPVDQYAYVAGTGLYVNVGGNPGQRQVHVGRRSYGFYLPTRSYVRIEGFTILEADDRGIQLGVGSSHDEIVGNVIRWSQRFGIQAVGSTAIRIASNRISESGDHGISLNSGTSACTIEDNESFLNALPTAREANGIYMFGSPANLLRGNRWHHNQDTGEQIQSGSNDVISIQNVSWANGDHGYDHLLATGSIHVGDVAYGNFKDGFSFEGSSSGCSVHDCIAIENGLTTNEIDLWVDDNSFVGFSSDDNIFWNSTAVPPIKRGLVRYATVQDWSAASGQDTRTFQADPRFADPANGDFHLMAGSPAIDAANSAVASWPALDAGGHARVDDPLTPNTGLGPVPYADRGAFEYPASPIGTAGVNPPPAGEGRRLSVFPNPLFGTGEAVFETSRPGTLRAGIYDLTGRCVRVLAGGEFAPGGSHRVSFEGTRDDGQRLEPGVYFLRVNGADGPLASRFLLIR